MRCEYCQKEYPVEDERVVGQEIRCPNCGIPSVCSDRRILIICPECHKELEGELWMLGTRAECTYCGKDILLSRPENPGDDYSNSYLPANYQLGNYLLKKCIGIGGMGEVYLAHHILLDRPCALKLLHPDHSGTIGDVSLDSLSTKPAWHAGSTPRTLWMSWMFKWILCANSVTSLWNMWKAGILKTLSAKVP